MVHTLSYIATLNATSFITGMRSMMASMTSVGSGMTSLTGKISNLVTTLAKIGAVLGIAAIGGAVIAMGKATQAAIAWEASMANVAKTTGLEGQELEDLGNEFLDLSTKISTSKEELASMGAVAGQLGIAKEDIGAFTETISKMSVAFDMTGEDAATSMAQIQNIWEKPVAEAEKFGSALNYLGNNTAASEKQLIAYMQNVGNSPKVLGLTQQETLAFGDILVAMGMDASDAGTRLNSAFSDRGLLGNLGAAAELAGMTEEQFKQMLDTDPTSAIVSVVDAISNVESNVDRVSMANEIFGVTGGKAIMPLIGQTDLLRQRIDEVNDAYDKGTSLQEEFAAKENTTAATIQRIKNTWSALLVDIGKNVNKSQTFQGILEKIHGWLLKAREIVQNFSIDDLKEKFSGVKEKIQEIGDSVVQNKDKILTLVTAFVLLKTGALQQIAIIVAQTLAGFARIAASGAASLAGMVSSVVAKYAMMATGAISHVIKMTIVITAQYARMAVAVLRECSIMAARVIATFTMMSAPVIATVARMTAAVIANIVRMGITIATTLLGPLVALLVPLALVTGAIIGLGAILNIDWESVKSGLTSIKDALLDVWESVKEGNFGEAFDKLKDHAGNAFDTIKDKLSNYDWSELPKKLVEDFKTGLATIKDVGSDIIEKLKSGAISAIGTFSEALDSLKNKIIGYDWENVGQQTAQLLKDAMHYAWLGLLALWDIGGQIWTWIKESLGKSEDTSWFKVISDAFWKFWDGFKTELIGDQTWGEALKVAVVYGYDKVIEVTKTWYATITNYIKGVLAVILAHLDIWTIDFINLWIYAVNGALDAIYNFGDWASAGFETVSALIKAPIDTIIGYIDSLILKFEQLTGLDLGSIGSGISNIMNPNANKKQYYELESIKYGDLSGKWMTESEASELAEKGVWKVKPGSVASTGILQDRTFDKLPSGETIMHTDKGDTIIPNNQYYDESKLNDILEKPQIEGQTAGAAAVWGDFGVVKTTEGQDISSYLGEAPGTAIRPSDRSYISPVGYMGGSREAGYEYSLEYFKKALGYNEIVDQIDTDEWTKVTKETNEYLEDSNKIAEEGNSDIKDAISDIDTTTDYSMTDITDTIADEAKTITETSISPQKTAVTGYWDPSGLGPDPMFAESIAAPNDIYVDRIIEKLQNAEYVHPAQLEFAASLNESSIDELLAKATTLLTENPPEMMPTIESTSAMEQSTELDTDISAMIPEMEVSLITKNALLDAQTLMADIEKMNPHMKVSVDVSANANQIASIAQAAVRDAIASAYSE